MTTSAPPDANDRQWISDLVDGQLEGPDLERVCARWAVDPTFRETWLTYQLIGDAMRSDDLALPPARSGALMNRLRDRLAHEPVVLAPSAMPSAPRARRQGWVLPAALAASVVAVLGGLAVLQQSTPADGPLLAARDAAVPSGNTQNTQMLRDARIDDYLRAHRETLAGSPAALPGGAMRSVDFNLPQR